MSSFGSLMTVVGRKDLRVETGAPPVEAVTLVVPALQTQLVQTPKNFQITCPALSQISSYKCLTQGWHPVGASLMLNASSCPSLP